MAAAVADITEDTEELEASAVSVASSIVEQLTIAAIEQPEVCMYMYVIYAMVSCGPCLTNTILYVTIYNHKSVDMKIKLRSDLNLEYLMHQCYTPGTDRPHRYRVMASSTHTVDWNTIQKSNVSTFSVRILTEHVFSCCVHHTYKSRRC